MTEDKDRLIEHMALFRHGLIARLLADELTPPQRQAEIAKIAATAHQIPSSLRTRVAESTLHDRLRAYRAGGFGAPKPKKRIDAGHPCTLDPALVERLLQLKENDPDRSIRLIIDQVREEGLIRADRHLSGSTGHRLFKQHGLSSRRPSDSPGGEDRRRFAYARAGQLRTSDVMRGPAIARSRGRGGARE